MQTTARHPAQTFGFAWGAVLTLIGAYYAAQREPLAALGFIAAALALFATARFTPRVLAIPSACWREIARAIGWLNARVLLAVIFGLIVVPMALWKRMTGSGGAQRLGKDGRWTPYPERLRDPKHFDRMY